MTDAPVRFGLIGCGAWGSHHAQAIAKTEGAQLVAIAEPSEESRAAAREAHPDVNVVADYRELVERDDLDVVSVVVPNRMHHEVGSAVLASAKHLLIEKPMCLSVAECDDLVRLARDHDRLVAVGHEFRLSSLWARVKELIDQGCVGRPQYALVELSRNPYRLGADGWRFDIARVGNWILEEPIHFFDLARWYLSSAGEPHQVFAAANSRQPDHPELQDNFSAILKFAGGPYAVVSQTLSAFEHHQTVKVTGTKGAVWAGWSGAMDRTRHPTFFLKAFDGEKLEEVPIARSAGELFELEDQVAMLVAAIRDGRPLTCTGEDGRWSVAICLAAQLSADSGRPVMMEEVIGSAIAGDRKTGASETMSENQAFADYLNRRCEYLTRTNTEIESKLSDDTLQLLSQLADGELSPKDPYVGQAFFRIDCIVGNTFRYTMLASVCSFLEEALKEMSRRVVPEYEQKLTRKRGNFLCRHIAILTDAGLDTAPIQPTIDEFDAIITIRNSIIHAWGRISADKNPGRLKSCIDSIEAAEESKDGFIILDDDVIPEAINSAGDIIEHILKSMLDATMT